MLIDPESMKTGYIYEEEMEKLWNVASWGRSCLQISTSRIEYCFTRAIRVLVCIWPL